MPAKHKVLVRQLEKAGFRVDQLPTDLGQWSEFLARVSSHYRDADEDRYLLERSLEISSAEMRERFSKINLLVEQMQLNEQVLKHLLAGAGYEQTMNTLVKNIEAHASAFRCALFVLNEKTQSLKLYAAPSLQKEWAEMIEVLPVGNRTCPCGQAAYFKTDIVYMNDPAHPQHEWLRKRGIESCYSFPVIDDKGRVVAVFSLFGDGKAQLTKTQSELMRSLGPIVQMAISHIEIKSTLEKEHVAMIARSKMATLGEMAGGVAHEINNPLFILQGYIDLVQANIEDGNVGLEDLGKTCIAMSAAIHRIARIVKTLRNFSRDASEDPLEPTDVEVLLHDALELCSKRYEGVNVEIVCPKETCDTTVMCRPVEVVQVVINLMNNAYYAVKNLPDPWIRVEVVLQGSTVEIKVTDSGKGIAEKALKNLFQPFVTTKPAGEGTGLGLSISKKIIESHSGRLYYNPKVQNTQFVVQLPIHKGAA